MDDPRHFWVFDSRVLDYLKVEVFTGFELLLIVLGLTALFLYFLLVVYLDRRARARRRRRRNRERLERWLESWQLAPAELDRLATLAGGDDPDTMYALVSDPVRFERSIHHAVRGGLNPAAFAFTDRLRLSLGYRSPDLNVPVVSTRQLVSGDAVRITVWEGGAVRAFYGRVTAVWPQGWALHLPEDALAAVSEGAGEVELALMRENDLEYRFPWTLQRRDPTANQVWLAHAMVEEGHRPRRARLPLSRRVRFRVLRQLAVDAVTELDPDTASSNEHEGTLLDLSEGGFALLQDEPLEPGAYVETALTRPGGRRMRLIGRVLETRPFSGTLWLSRCELRGMRPTERNALAQLVRLALRRRAGNTPPHARRP